MGESSGCSTSLPAFGVCSDPNFGHSRDLIAVLIRSSLKIYDVAHPFFLLSFPLPPSFPFLLFFLFLNNMLPWWLSGKESTFNAGDVESIPGSRRSPGEGNGNPLQYSCLGNSIDRGAWRATVHGVAKETDTTERLNNSMLIAISQAASFQVFQDAVVIFQSRGLSALLWQPG